MLSKKILFLITAENEIKALTQFGKKFKEKYDVQMDVIYVKDVLKYEIFPVAVEGIGVNVGMNYFVKEYKDQEEKTFQKIKKQMDSSFEKVYAKEGETDEVALEELKKTFKIPIIGVIKAGAKTAINTTKSGNIGVIGTKATVNSKRYEEEIKKLSENVKVIAKACPLFVPAVEEGILDGKLVDQIIKTYLDDFEKEIDTLILGCTHYPLLKSAIGKIYTNLNIVDPARETALDLKEILEEKNLLKNDATKNREVKYYVTDGKDKFKEIGIMFLDENIEKVELVKL